MSALVLALSAGLVVGIAIGSRIAWPQLLRLPQPTIHCIYVAAPPRGLQPMRPLTVMPPRAQLPAISTLHPGHYLVDRAALRRELAVDPAAMAPSARIIPSIADGKPAGFRVYAIRPSSLYARLGIENGDRIERVNGVALDSPDRMLSLYRAVQESRRVRVDLTRRQRPVQLFYDFAN